MLNRLIVVNSDHGRGLCSSYLIHHNRIRPHQVIAGKVPDEQGQQKVLEADLKNSRIKMRSELSGLATHFSLAA